MNNILLLVFALLTVCLTNTFAQPIANELTTPSTAADEESPQKRVRPDANFGTFELYGQKLVATDRYIPEKDDYVFEITDSNNKVLYLDTHDEDYPVSIVYKLVGDSGEGLLIIRELFPTAPPCGPEFKVLGLKDGKIKELSQSIVMCGWIVEDTISPTENTIILTKNNILTAAFSAGNYFIKVPFKIDFKNFSLFPLKKIGEFSAVYDKREMDRVAFGDSAIDLYSSRDLLSKKTTIPLRAVKNFEVLNIYASVKIQEDVGTDQSEIVIAEKSIKVRVNGNIYWLNEEDKSYLAWLGLPWVD